MLAQIAAIDSARFELERGRLFACWPRGWPGALNGAQRQRRSGGAQRAKLAGVARKRRALSARTRNAQTKQATPTGCWHQLVVAIVLLLLLLLLSAVAISRLNET